MRSQTYALAFSLAAVLSGGSIAHAQTKPAPAAAPAPAPATQFSDAELGQFAKAMEAIRAMNITGAPTAEQTTAMQKAVTDNGLTAERFNAISMAASRDPVVRARVAVAAATPSAAGSVGAAVTDAELGQYARAMNGIRALNVTGTPTAEQTAAMQKSVSDAGLTAERFNAISTAIPQDAHLRARAELAAAQAG